MNMKAKLLILGVLSVFAMAFVSSCKDEESFVKAESVSISPAKVTLTAGEHTELTATVPASTSNGRLPMQRSRLLTTLVELWLCLLVPLPSPSPLTMVV